MTLNRQGADLQLRSASTEKLSEAAPLLADTDGSEFDESQDVREDGVS